jgi:hypothetical protein
MIVRVILIIVVLIIFCGGIFFLLQSRLQDSPPALETVTPLPVTITPTSVPTSSSPIAKLLQSKDIPSVAKEFQFTAEIPNGWQAEAVPAIEAVNIYDPSLTGANNLEKSQIFIRHFSANTFLTLSTVTIHTKEDQKFNNHPAVRYDIEKKASVPDFPNQPTWRNQRHIVTDIRVSDSSPSVFYVIAKNPTLDEVTYQTVLKSLQFE